MLKYIGIDGTIVDKEAIAIQRIKKYEPLEGYVLAFSGGKDSICIYHLAKRAGVNFEANYNRTTVDYPEVIEFIKKEYPNVEWIKPKKTMFQLIKTRKIPPTRNIRYCCHVLKELHGVGRVLILGVRREESVKRRNRPIYEQSNKNKNTHYLNPIVDWSTSDVWEFIHKYKLPYPSVYDEGFERVGCIMCPLQTSMGMIRDGERYPKFKKAYIRAFDAMLLNHSEEARKELHWKTGEDVMYWWIYGSHEDKTTYQEKL